MNSSHIRNEVFSLDAANGESVSFDILISHGVMLARRPGFAKIKPDHPPGAGGMSRGYNDR